MKLTLDKPQPLQNIVCDICLDPYNSVDDRLVFCQKCRIIVHQSCYGSDLLEDFPESGWTCQKCAKRGCLPTDFIIRCRFCPNVKGPIKMFKIIDCPGIFWAHVQCINWMPELIFETEENCIIEDKQTYEYVIKSRTIEPCYFCKEKYGCTVKCDFAGCGVYFHITCAQKWGVIINPGEMKKFKDHRPSQNFLPMYCLEHQTKIIKEKAWLRKADMISYGKSKIMIPKTKSEIENNVKIEDSIDLLVVNELKEQISSAKGYIGKDKRRIMREFLDEKGEKRRKVYWEEMVKNENKKIVKKFGKLEYKN